MENLTTHNKLAVEVLVGKKNLEVRPLAVNKGEIVKRILYDNPDSEFVFCAGDDKTDEDMFRALCNLEPAPDHDDIGTVSGTGGGTGAEGTSSEDVPLIMSPPAPLSSTQTLGSPRTLALRREAIFATTIGPSGKKTLARWHVDGTDKIIGSLSEMAGLPGDDGSANAQNESAAPTANNSEPESVASVTLA